VFHRGFEEAEMPDGADMALHLSLADTKTLEEIEKLRIEKQKLAEEARKLQGDRHWWVRHVAVAGALCGVLATSMLGYSQFQDSRAKNALDAERAIRADHRQTLELQRQQLETRLKLVEFGLKNGQEFLGGDLDRQRRFVLLVRGLMPDAEAMLLLDTLGRVATQAPIVSLIAQERTSLSTTGTAAGAAAAPGSQPPAEQLRVFSHIWEDNDRRLAVEIVAGLGEQFPSGGVEYVSSWNARPRAAGEVRFYRSAQAPTARALADLLRERTRAATGQEVEFRAVDISGTYPNLPGGRVEVWFPKLD
jgi:hypothetical protein